jgi:hypothetical protein
MLPRAAMTRPTTTKVVLGGKCAGSSRSAAGSGGRLAPFRLVSWTVFGRLMRWLRQPVEIGFYDFD